MAVAGRFAPSPTGRMHLGNVFAALVSYLDAKSAGGEWVLRIEDLDAGRCREEYVEALEDDLRFLGLKWDRGGSSDPSYRQSRRGHIYQRYLDLLEEAGLTYPCWCTRASLNASSAPHESDGRLIYPGTCRDNPERAAQNAGRPYSVRLRVGGEDIHFTDLHYGEQTVNLASHCGDFILRRSDGAWAYQLAVVIDDALMGISRVARGRDLLLSCAQQKYLCSILGFDVPQYAHFPLLCASDGRRLCKRDLSLDMGRLRENFRPEELIGSLAFRAGLIADCEPCAADELIPLFSWDRLPREDIILSPSPTQDGAEVHPQTQNCSRTRR